MSLFQQVSGMSECLGYRKALFPSATLSCLRCKLSISLSENGLTASVSGLCFLWKLL